MERHGGRGGIRDRGLLESAAVPEASFGGALLHPSLFSMAAAYAYHIAENQPFIDGNKRAGLAAALVFLELNGVSINDPRGSLYGAMMDIAARKMTKEGLANLLERLAGG
ncbi:MAG: type II toxin-antitoxin system death-on-curing family toxin [Elusimicrobiota bacterium]|nr:type II toxin-antitoxin system death-on-curing family toxin [Elusimicrobiota bacterium]